MRPGSHRLLLLDGAAARPTVEGETGVVQLGEETQSVRADGRRGYLVQAVGRGRATVRSGDTQWHIEVRGASRKPEQTRDDTDSGWGEDASGRSQRWWEEQRPPHW